MTDEPELFLPEIDMEALKAASSAPGGLQKSMSIGQIEQVDSKAPTPVRRSNSLLGRAKSK